MESLKNAPLITVFTATYNRGHLIQRIYQSLLRQKEFNFEWLVIDDGSQDQTEDLFNDWTSRDNPFEIRYYKQENRGLIRTLNRGIELARGEYFAKIDSDDYVVDDYATNISKWVASIENSTSIYAVSGVRVTPDGIPLKGKWPDIPRELGFVDATDLERAAYDLDADMCEAWRTDVLRNYPFPVWNSEKFAPEQIVFNQIALDGYKIRWYPVAMSICEYQEGGLTKGAVTGDRKPDGVCDDVQSQVKVQYFIQAKTSLCYAVYSAFYCGAQPAVYLPKQYADRYTCSTCSRNSFGNTA